MTTLQHMDIADAIARLSAHEQVCGFRYESLESRTTRIENILWAVAGATILQLVAIIVALVIK
jgi:hypothetical protein